MDMKALKNRLGLGAVAIAILALPAAAAGEPVVPPENSAATQYTEALPTGGGSKDAGKVGDRDNVKPAAVLGADKAKKLESHGKEGREVAEVVAATAPSPAPAPPPSPEPAAPGGSGDGAKATQDSGGASQAKLGDSVAVTPLPVEPSVRQVDIPTGSSGLGEVLAQATGSSSSGQLGALLPLLIVAALAWALAFLWRQRQRTA